MGFLPWKRTVVQIHGGDQINEVMGLDFFPVEGLPYEYGGKAGAMKDLNGEWFILHSPKNILSSSIT